MKKLFLILLTIISLSVNATEIDSLSLPQSETERLIDKYSSNIIEGFNTVIEKVTPVAEQGFNIAVKLQFAKGIAWLIGILITIILSYLTYQEYKRIRNILNSDNIPENYNTQYGAFSEENTTPFLLIGTIMSAIMILFSISFTYAGVTHLMAPEWYAIKEIIKLF